MLDYFPETLVPATQTFMFKLNHPVKLRFNLERLTIEAYREGWCEKMGGGKFAHASSFTTKVTASRQLTLKVFSNGVLQITGCKKEQDMRTVAQQYMRILSSAHCIDESQNAEHILFAYSTMLNVNIKLKEKLDLKRFDQYLIQLHELFPHSFNLAYSVHDKKVKGSCVKLKKLIEGMAKSPVFVFAFDRNGEVEERESITLANYSANFNTGSPLTKRKEVSIYFYPDAKTIFFSSTNKEASAFYYNWIKDLLTGFELWRKVSEVGGESGRVSIGTI